MKFLPLFVLSIIVLPALTVLWTVQPAPAQVPGCVGDCKGDDSVTVDELLKGVSIALGTLPLSQCSPFDLNGDGAVTVDEILIAVNNALEGCPTGELIFDKISLAVFPGGEETVSVTATDGSGNPVDWTVASSAPSVVSALQIGSEINVTGVGLGAAVIMVTTQTGLRRSVPVRVYDPMVLDAGEIRIRYIDTFECFLGFPLSVYRPVVPAGWHALGSFAIATLGCPDINGQQWMMAVKENPEHADPITPPLVAPQSMVQALSFAFPSFPVAGFWTPSCPAGYVPMGTVVTTGATWFPLQPPPSAPEPSVDDVTCIRKDLTAPGAGDPIGASDSSFVRIVAPDNSNFENTTAYLETEAFSVRGSDVNVLAVELPPLINVPFQTWAPHLVGFFAPPAYSEPVLAEALLVPFTLLNGQAYAAKGVGWMVENSPFVRVERVQSWGLVFFVINNSSVAQNPSVTFTKGVSTADTNSISVKAGISLTVESGFELLGIGGKVSATVSTEFGYETQHSVSEFGQESDTVPINVAPHKAAAAWQLRSTIIVKLRNPQTGQLNEIAAAGESTPMYDSLAYAYADYPN